jgi:hypothetical protein
LLRGDSVDVGVAIFCVVVQLRLAIALVAVASGNPRKVGFACGAES